MAPGGEFKKRNALSCEELSTPCSVSVAAYRDVSQFRDCSSGLGLDLTRAICSSFVCRDCTCTGHSERITCGFFV